MSDKIQSNKVVTVSYELSVDEDGKETQVEKTEEDKPFTFVHGTGNLLPEFENKLEGLKEGENFDFKIDAENAYGQPNPQAVISVPKAAFTVEGKVADDLLQIGNFIPMKDEKGNKLQGQVVEIEDESVKMDFNHPLAGKDLHFKGDVKEVRDASEEEIKHGHAHG